MKPAAIARAGFVYVWEYRVAPEALDAFLEAYRPGGTWTRLFEGADGYVRTELLRDAAVADRFVSLDYWRSRSDRDRFREEQAAAFESLDARCESLTLEERRLGDFVREAEPERGPGSSNH